MTSVEEDSTSLEPWRREVKFSDGYLSMLHTNPSPEGEGFEEGRFREEGGAAANRLGVDELGVAEVPDR